MHDLLTSDARHLSKANLSSPSIRVDQLERISQDIDISTSTKTIPEKVDLAKAIQNSQYSVILGDPGAGKTTLLKYLALHFATAQRDDQKTLLAGEAEENLGQTRLPVFFRIADYAERLATQSDLSLQQFLREFSQQWQSEVTNQTDNELSNSPLNPPILGDFETGVSNSPLNPPILGDFDSISPQDWGVRGAGDFETISPQDWGVRGAKPSQLRRSDNTTTIFEHLRDKLDNGKCLVLLDGLDEVFNQDIRQQIVNQIEGFVDEFPNNKFVITSRIAGYREVKLSQRFSHFTITEMEPEQVERFLDRWCLAVEKAQRPDASQHYWQQEADHQSGELKKAIAASEGVKRMTGNPLLLTILALIHRNGSRLPNQRVKLYELAVQTLTEDWQLSKKLPGVETVVLKESQVMALLAPLAYWMHEHKPSGLVSEPEVREKLAEIHGELNDEEPDSQSVQWQINDFLLRVRETTGLFVERAPGSYGFMHLTFEEYFAARYIADNDVSEILDIINQHRYEARWDEPILLALGYLSGNHKRVNNLVTKLFKPLDDYQPRIDHGEIKIRKTSSKSVADSGYNFAPLAPQFGGEQNSQSPPKLGDLGGLTNTKQSRIHTSIQQRPSKDVVLVWPVLGEDSTVSYQESPLVLQDLLFAGKVLADVDVNSKIRARVIQQLVWTYLGLNEDFDNETIKELLIRLRDIERFNQKDEVIKCLHEAANTIKLSEEQWVKTQLGSLYVACAQAGETLVSGVNEFVQQLLNQAEPKLFNNLIDLVIELGEEMTPALEATRQHPIWDQASQQAIEFVTALSYLRPDHYDQAIGILEEIYQEPDSPINADIAWAIATCYYKKKEYDKAITYYQQSRDLNQQLGNQKNVGKLWYWLAICYRLSGKYHQALDCELKDLAIRQQLDDKPEIALAYYQLGRIYQDWGKYDQAIQYHQQSRDLYHQLDKQKNVATQWSWLANCYRDWGRYQQAVDCQLKTLAIRQQLDHQPGVASAYCKLGYIYQGWGKYDQAVPYYQQSRDLYHQLDLQKGVANQWYLLAVCYGESGNYQQAVDCQLKDLAIREQLDDQPNLADAYYQLGYIYQGWGKYDQAIAYYEQSRDLYHQLDLQKNVANQWYRLAVCYRESGNYQQAVDCELKDLEMRQQLDDKKNLADAYYQLGRIYEDWGKYDQAIAFHQQSLELYDQLDLQKDVADSWRWLADCYRELGDYTKAIDYYQKSLNLHQQLGQNEQIANRYRKIGNSQRLLARNTPDTTEALNLLSQGEQSIGQAMEISKANDYKASQANNYTALGLLSSERLRRLPSNHPTLLEQIEQFETNYTMGLRLLSELGQHVNRAEKILDISRAYLEVNVLENLDRAEALALESLQVFLDYNRRKLEASARQLLGEIYLRRVEGNQGNDKAIAYQFFTESLELYRSLDINGKVIELEQQLKIVGSRE